MTDKAMTDKAMTDKEIIKALECCHKGYAECRECPSRYRKSVDCVDHLTGSALSLINRQKEEIEKWKEAFNNLDKIARPNLAFVEAAKKQAVREFAEKLKESAFDVDVSFGYGKICYDKAVAVIEIDNLVKEMVGEDDTSHPDERKEKSNEHN